MDIILNDIEARVLGCLLEKSLTTPEYYPLSLHALTAACNQKSNRQPVVNFEETTVVRAIDGLKAKRLVVQSDSSRVPKYEEIFVRGHNLVNREASIFMVLLLRGTQTLGELRSRTERVYKFSGLEEVESTIDELIDSGYVVKLPRLPGMKEHRYAHLLSGEPEVEIPAPRLESATLEIRTENERMSRLIEEVEHLRAELASLKEDFIRFKSEFE